MGVLTKVLWLKKTEEKRKVEKTATRRALPATITHVPVAAVLVLNTPDDGRLRPKDVE